VEELQGELMGAVMFLKVDLWSGYHQIKMACQDTYKTEFHTHNDHYDFIIMPFGLTNTLVTFQSVMDEIFKSTSENSYWYFLMTFFKYSKYMAEHLEHLQWVFDLLGTHNLFVKESKCEFCSNQVKYMAMCDLSGWGSYWPK